MSSIDNIVEKEFRNHTFYFQLDYNHDFKSYAGKITEVNPKVYTYDKEESDVCTEDGEPLKKVKRLMFLAVAWAELKAEVIDEMCDRIEDYVMENEAEEIQCMRDYWND